ncbi:MAG TPA: DNA topoisomerase VI subunit B [Candidatus Krumholzibacteria bacterium]|nr:DNA topoisomerase VI subunit B [Candidatus Krumholzibacteria bacterium]
MTVRIKKSTGAPVVFGTDAGEESARRLHTAAPERGAASTTPKKPGSGKAGREKPVREKKRPEGAAAKPMAKKKRREAAARAVRPKKRPEGATAKAVPRKSRREEPAMPATEKPARVSSSREKPESSGAQASTAKPRNRREARTAKSQAAGRRASAETLASRQREISVSEFFTKNRHLLGFDSPARGLLTTVKEAVDNSLDAAEEAGILPTVRVQLVEISEDRYRVMVQDNGPGIVKAQVPKIFGKLLYGSKFHRLKMSRGQQGIGISAAGMYGQLTTGKPVVITSKTGKGKPAHHFEIVIDTTKNAPVVVKDDTLEWEPDHGTRLEIELQGSYKGGRRSVDEYLEQVALANPHAEIFYSPPRDRPEVHFERLSAELPPEPQEIQPHPYGVELGVLQQLLKDTKARTLSAALQSEFSRVSPKVASEILGLAGLAPNRRPHELKPGEVELLHRSIPKVKILAPPATSVVPIGEALIQRGLEREIRAEFTCSSTRPPAVYRGNPFIVEAGLAYGGDLRQVSDDDSEPLATARAEDAQQGPITLLRLANRAPLQYQQSSCAIFRAAVETNWRQYGLSQPKASLPQGPMVLLVHLASVWVPFTSESKEAVAHYPEIVKEIRLALLECGRKLGTYLRRREHARREERRRSIFEMYIGELVESLGKLTQTDRKKLQAKLLELARQHTGDAGEAATAYVAPSRRVRVESPAEPRDDDDEQAQLRLGLEENG